MKRKSGQKNRKHAVQCDSHSITISGVGLYSSAALRGNGTGAAPCQDSIERDGAVQVMTCAVKASLERLGSKRRSRLILGSLKTIVSRRL